MQDNITLRITCTVPNLNKPGTFRELGRYVLSLDSNLVFPFDRVISVLRLLYPQKDLVINMSIL